MKVHRGKKKRRLCVWPKLVLEWVSSLILDLPYLRVTLRIAFIRVIRKARKTQHQNPEFGQTQCEILKKPSKKYISIQPRGGGKRGGPQKSSHFCVNWVSSCLSFFLSASTSPTDIFTAPTCTTTTITLEPCALNAEFQHFILRFNIIFLLCGYHWKRGVGSERRSKDRVKTGLLYR
jgi:hypothetical protein